MALTKTVAGAVNQILCMDGTTAIKDAIHNLAFTTTNVAPTTAALLGATAPVISAAAYTSCKIATPFTAGQALSIMCVVNTTWAGNDGVAHELFDTQYDATRRIYLAKTAANVLTLAVVATGGTKIKSVAVTGANWAANVNHVVIATIDAANAQQLFLGPAAATTSSGTSGREDQLGTQVAIGATQAANVQPLNGAILCAIWGRVLTSGEITALSAAATWASVIDLPQITVHGLSPGNAVRLYDSTGNVHASAVESGGTATLTYTLD